jgi:hypothetical protein
LRQPASRAQYYAGLARVLDPGNIPEGDLVVIEDRIKTIQRAVFAEQQIAVYDYSTAMSSDIVKRFEKHVVVFSSTHRVPFSKLASVIVQHSTLQAAIMLGHPADMRYGSMQLASRGRNVVMTTIGRRAWDVLDMAGGSHSTNVI